MTTENNTVYFKGLNGLRFFAAFAVVITHIELIKNALGMKNYWKNHIVFNLGGLGVYFFFVLSGFLITYLLLTEKKRYQDINIKSFYIRRILRIWPLYYFILILGFFILPQFSFFKIPYLENSFSENFYSNLILYILILPNLAFSLFPAVPNIGQAWSIGVEEQFYIIWPWIIHKSKNIFKTLFTLIIALIIFKVIILLLGWYYNYSSWYEPLKLFVAMSKFECMAIGGIGAYLVFKKHIIISYLNHKLVLWLSIFSIPILILYTPNIIQDGIHIVYSIIFLTLIIFISGFNNIKLLEHPMLNYLGKISYGIYMYHFMIIPFILNLAKAYITNINNEIVYNIIVYTIVIIATIATASLSYFLIEQPFIKLKGKYSPVKSGD
jgi:peptidoglycan/LPS O-acetylase OafA/YrhL